MRNTRNGLRLFSNKNKHQLDIYIPLEVKVTCLRRWSSLLMCTFNNAIQGCMLNGRKDNLQSTTDMHRHADTAVVNFFSDLSDSLDWLSEKTFTQVNVCLNNICGSCPCGNSPGWCVRHTWWGAVNKDSTGCLSISLVGRNLGEGMINSWFTHKIIMCCSIFFFF